MTITYRTAGAWGAGKGADLTPAEVDANFRDVVGRVETLEDALNGPAAPETITLDDDAVMTFTLTDASTHTIRPPFKAMNWRGEWQPSTIYSRWDVVGVTNDGLYLVEEDHTSASTFDPDADLASGGVAATYALMMDVSAGPPLGSGSHNWSPYHGGVELVTFTGNYQPYFTTSPSFSQAGYIFRFAGNNGNFVLPGSVYPFPLGTEFTLIDRTTGGSTGGVEIWPANFNFVPATIIGPGGFSATEANPLITNGPGSVVYIKKVVGTWLGFSDPAHVWEVWGDVSTT